MLVLYSIVAAFFPYVIKKFLWWWKPVAVKVNVSPVTEVPTGPVCPFPSLIVQIKNATLILAYFGWQIVSAENSSKRVNT